MIRSSARVGGVSFLAISQDTTRTRKAIEFPHGVDHCDHLRDGRAGLNVVNGVEDEPSTLREDLAAAQDLFADFLRSAEWQYLLRVGPAAQEHQIAAELLFEGLGVH